MIKYIIYLARVFFIASKRFLTGQYTFYVSALAFTTLLSIVPLLSVSIFVLSKFMVFSNLIKISEKYIFTNFIPTSAASIQVYFENFIQQTVNLPIFSIIFLIATAIMTINTIDDTINDIWNITKKRRKLFVWIIYLLILLLAPLLLGISIFLTSYIFTFYFLTPINSFLFLILPILINTIIFSLFYIYAPNARVKKSDGFLVGFIAALLIEIARILFAIWISNFSTYEIVYGVFSILPIFFIWLYTCWFIILWGALVTYTLSQSKHLRY